MLLYASATQAQQGPIAPHSGGPDQRTVSAPTREQAREGSNSDRAATKRTRAANETELTPQDFEDARTSPEVRADRARQLARETGPEAEDYYLFVPRAALLLPRLVLQVAFLPVRGAAILVDKYHVVEHVKDVLYNDARTAGIIPTLGYRSEYGVTGGAKAFHNDLFGNEEELALSAEYGGVYLQAYKLSFEGDQVSHSPLWLESDLRYEHRPGVLFWGIGNQSLDSGSVSAGADPHEVARETRFRETRFMASALVGETIEETEQRSQFGMMGIYNRRRFAARSRHFDAPSLDEIYDPNLITGYASGVDVLELGPVFVFDSRNAPVLTASGSYLDSFGAYALPMQQRAGYWHYGLTAAGFIDLYGGTRVLSLRAVLEAVHGKDADIPFTELVKLGGAERLRGYGSDRFRDKVSFVATAEYRYPVHEFVAGELFVDAGRVGPDYRSTFEFDESNPVRVGAGAGFVFHDAKKLLFKAEIAYGEELSLFLSSDPLELFANRHKRL